MQIGFYAGSFDPFTNGHLHVVKKAAVLYDKVIVGIGVHPKKTRRFDKELMRNVIEQILIREKLDNVTVVTYDNLTAEAALEYDSTDLVRGLRDGMDYGYEEKMAAFNEEISGLDTVYVRAGRLGIVSSSAAMELLRTNNKNVTKFLPPEVLAVVSK